MKGYIALGLVCLSLSFSSCTRSQGELTSKFHQNGHAKPLIAVLPVQSDVKLDHYEWDVKQELTEGIRKHLYSKGKLYVIPKTDDVALAQTLEWPSGKNPSAEKLRTQLEGSQYVVVTELIDYHEEPYARGHKSLHTTGSETDTLLVLKVRLTVLDIRGQEVLPILQEIVQSSYMLPLKKLGRFGSEMNPEHAGYLSTPIGVAHAGLEKDVAERIQEYVLIAHSMG